MQQGRRRLAELIRAEAARRGSLRALADAAGVSLRTIERLAAAEDGLLALVEAMLST